METIFSLICPTLGRYNEVDCFLESIKKQTFDINKIEIIIIDQNQNDYLLNIINKYDDLNIIYIKSQVLGLSHNRNKGMAASSGKIISFPDDDCTYYPNTLETVMNYFESNPNVEIFLGRIVDINDKSILRKWSSKKHKVNKYNHIAYGSSITMFLRNNRLVKFDENFGAGTKLGSSEDGDFLYSYFYLKKIVMYEPDIKVWHPEQQLKSNSTTKVISYGLGFGAFIRKHNSLSNILVFALVCARLLLRIVINSGTNREMLILSLKSRIKGFLNYKKIIQND